jgi:DNA-binding IclR family transcriptional regulator
LPKKSDGQGAQLLDRAFNIIRLVADNNTTGLRISDIVRDTGLTAPTGHRLVRALERHAYLERDEETARYHLGSELFVLGVVTSKRFDLVRAAAGSIARLAQQTEDTVLLTLRHQWQAACVAREEGPFPIRSQVVMVGARHPLGVSAGGMAILAALADDEIREALEFNAAEIAERYPNYSKKVIHDNVEEARKEGFAINRGLVVSGSWGVAVSIAGPTGHTVGAITVAGIQQRFVERSRQRQLGALIRAEVSRIEERLARPGHEPTSGQKKTRA